MRAKNFECKVVWIFIFYVIKDVISFLFFNFFVKIFYCPYCIFIHFSVL